MAEETSVFSLWGSNRTLRNLQLLPPVECVAGEEAKLEEMRALMGPFASEARLTSHLRAVRGKVFWAVNRYLREELMLGTVPDFAPKPLRPTQTPPGQPQMITTNCQNRVTGSFHQVPQRDAAPVESFVSPESGTVEWEQLPDCLTHVILAKLSHQDLLQLSSSCKWLNTFASSDTLWRSLCLHRWGTGLLSALNSDGFLREGESEVAEGRQQSRDRAEMESGVARPAPPALRVGSELEEAHQSLTSSCQDAANDSLPAVDWGIREERSLGLGLRGSEWKERFHLKLTAEQASRCPQCLASSFVPIVYGFPSEALVVGMKSARLLLGGDHLSDYPGFSPLWACGGCNALWLTHPYSAQSKGPLEELHSKQWQGRPLDG